MAKMMATPAFRLTQEAQAQIRVANHQRTKVGSGKRLPLDFFKRAQQLLAAWHTGYLLGGQKRRPLIHAPVFLVVSQHFPSCG